MKGAAGRAGFCGLLALAGVRWGDWFNCEGQRRPKEGMIVLFKHLKQIVGCTTPRVEGSESEEYKVDCLIFTSFVRGGNECISERKIHGKKVIAIFTYFDSRVVLYAVCQLLLLLFLMSC